MRLLVTALAVAAAAARLDAQTVTAAPAPIPPRPYTFSVAGGTALVTGEDRDYYSPGFHLQGSVGVALPARYRLSLRADAMYERVPGRDRSTQRYPGGPDTLLIGDLSVLSGTVSAVYHVGGLQRAVRPYVLLGPGLFRLEQEGVLYDQPVSGAESRFGVSAGGGVAFPVGPLAAFAEARVHNVFADGGSARLYPIVVGVQF